MEPAVVLLILRVLAAVLLLLFFGVIGGTFTGIMARKLSVGWVRINPTMPVRAEEGWGVTLTLPSN